MMTASRRFVPRTVSRLWATCSAIGLCCSTVNSADLDPPQRAAGGPAWARADAAVAPADAGVDVTVSRSWQQVFEGHWR